MLTAVVLQCAATAILGLVTFALADAQSAISLVLGAGCALVPNALFAMRLVMNRGRSPESYPVIFFLGEFAKIGLTIFLLALLVKTYVALQWLPMLIGLIVALKAPLLALWLTGNRRPVAHLLPVASGSMASQPKAG